MGMRLVSCLIALALVGSASAELVGYWQLDEGAGTTTADRSGNGNVGTLVGGPEWVAGYYGGALQFNGASSYVEIPSSDSLAATEQVTVMAWANWTDAGDGWLCLLANGQQNGPWENYGLFVNRTSRFAYFTLSLNDTHTPQQAPNNTVVPGEWQHICGTWDGLAARIYVDGELRLEVSQVRHSHFPAAAPAVGPSQRQCPLLQWTDGRGRRLQSCPDAAANPGSDAGHFAGRTGE